MADKSKNRKIITGILLCILAVFFFTYGETILDGLVDGFNATPDN